MSKRSLKRALIPGLVLCLVVGLGNGMAEDAEARGDTLWLQRDSIDRTFEAVAAWESAARVNAKDPGLWVKIGHGYYWLAMLSPDKKDKVAMCEKGLVALERAISLDRRSVAANYWHMVTQGTLTEAKGILSGFDFGNAIEKTLLVTSEDDSFHFGGVYRFWGRVIYFIPPKVGWFFKFSLDDAVKDFHKAIAFEPNFFENRLYLAETYIKMKKEDEARRELEYILRTDPEKCRGRGPENRLIRKQAKKLLTKMR